MPHAVPRRPTNPASWRLVVLSRVAPPQDTPWTPLRSGSTRAESALRRVAVRSILPASERPRHHSRPRVQVVGAAQLATPVSRGTAQLLLQPGTPRSEAARWPATWRTPAQDFARYPPRGLTPRPAMRLSRTLTHTAQTLKQVWFHVEHEQSQVRNWAQPPFGPDQFGHSARRLHTCTCLPVCR